MLALSGRRGRSMNSRSRARPHTCPHLSSVGRTVFPRLGGILPLEASDQALLKVAPVQILDAMKKWLRKHLHSADDHSWTLNHHRYLSVVSPALIMKDRNFRPPRLPRRLLWRFRPGGDHKIFRNASSLRLEMDQRLHRVTYHPHDPHRLQHRRSHRPRLQLCPSRHPSPNPLRSLLCHSKHPLPQLQQLKL